MKVQVKLFAAAKQIAGRESVEVEMDSAPTVANLRDAMSRQFPALSDLLRHAMFAVNAEYVSPNTSLANDQEIACIPPVSGG